MLQQKTKEMKTASMTSILPILCTLRPIRSLTLNVRRGSTSPKRFSTRPRRGIILFITAPTATMASRKIVMSRTTFGSTLGTDLLSANCATAHSSSMDNCPSTRELQSTRRNSACTWKAKFLTFTMRRKTKIRLTSSKKCEKFKPPMQSSKGRSTYKQKTQRRTTWKA